MNNTKQRALHIAKDLLQRLGYHGFSFQHVADAVGIQKPSLYEHFASKQQLGEALIDDYSHRFRGFVESIDAVRPEEKIVALFELYFKFSKDRRKVCPLTALSVDGNSLPTPMNSKLRKMHQFQKHWLVGAIEEGKKKKVFKNRSPSFELAEILMSLAYGAQLSARILRDPTKIHQARDLALVVLKGAGPRPNATRVRKKQ